MWTKGMSTEKKKSKRGPGRPSKEKTKKGKSVRFEQDDLELFEREAKKKNQDFSTWIRETLKRATKE